MISSLICFSKTGFASTQFLQARAKAEMQKLDNLADTNEKFQTVRAVKQLQQASKRVSGQTTIIQVSAVFWCGIYPGQIQVGPRPVPNHSVYVKLAGARDP